MIKPLSKAFKITLSFTSILIFLTNSRIADKSYALSNFSDFQTAIQTNDYYINLEDYQIPLIFSQTIDSAGLLGTIRGRTGSDFAILDGDNQRQGFNFTVGITANFQSNILFQNFKQAASGGVIFMRAHTNINFINASADFFENQAGNGGAILSMDSSINFSNSFIRFIGNSANGDGGAIFINGTPFTDSGSSITFSNSSINFIGNSANYNGGAIESQYSSISFSNSFISFIANQAASGGAINIIGNQNISFTNSSVSFRGNIATIRGGAIMMTLNNLLILDGGNFNINFENNLANNKPNDIYFESYGSSVIFSVNRGAKIIMDGGISANAGISNANYIIKNGAGLLHIKERAVFALNTADRFNINVGITSFSATSATFGTLAIGAGAKFAFDGNQTHTAYLQNLYTNGTLHINVDLFNRISDTFEIFGSMNSELGSSLSVNFYGSSVSYAGQWINVFHLRGGGSGGYDFTYLLGNNYEYDLRADPIDNEYIQIGAIEYIGPPIPPNPPYIDPSFIDPSFYANISALPAKMFWDYGAILDSKRIEANIETEEKNEVEPFWIIIDILGSSRSGDKIEKDSLESSGSGVKAGYNFWIGGGIFISYQSLDANQGNAEANIENLELGFYKTLKINNSLLANGMLGFGWQSFDVKNGAQFGAKTIKFLLEGEYIDKNMFATLRGGYATSDEVDDNDSKMSVEDYFGADLLFGAKKNYQINQNLTLIFKAYAGIPITANYRPQIKTDNGTIEGIKEGSLFGGTSGRIRYALGNIVDIFGGMTIEFDETFAGYSAYCGASVKLGK